MAPNVLSTRSNLREAIAPPVPRPPPRAWWLLLVLCLGVAAYSLGYVVLGDRVYPSPLADSFRARPWGIYPHAFFGMIALAAGPFQFRRRTLLHRPRLHRVSGRVYLVSALAAGIAGLYMSFYSFGGLVTHFGFGLLAAGLLLCSTIAWLCIRRGDVPGHRAWVSRSFVLLFSAVTLRLWLPVLSAGLGSFEPAYQVVSWLCWVPNLLAVEVYLRFTRSMDPLTGLPIPHA